MRTLFSKSETKLHNKFDSTTIHNSYLYPRSKFTALSLPIDTLLQPQFTVTALSLHHFSSSKIGCCCSSARGIHGKCSKIDGLKPNNSMRRWRASMGGWVKTVFEGWAEPNWSLLLGVAIYWYLSFCFFNYYFYMYFVAFGHCSNGQFMCVSLKSLGLINTKILRFTKLWNID